MRPANLPSLILNIAFMDSLLQELVRNGFFGNIKFISYSPDKNEKIAPSYSSTINFGILTYEEYSSTKYLSLVIKTQILDPKEREFRDCDQMFLNETLMYNVILPTIGADKRDLFPKVLYSKATGGKNIVEDIIVLQNLSQIGFKHSSDFFLDYDHLSIAIRKLALFHSLSFTYKSLNYKEFIELTKGLKECWYKPGLPRDIKAQSLAAIKRGIQPLIDQGYGKETFINFLNSFDSLFKVVEYLKAPEEPFGVICHGDFLQNNMRFKYDGKKPVDFRIFDLQNSKYSTPAFDLSKFLYSNTSKEIREKYWDSLLKLYWEEFTGNLPKDVEHPAFEEFLEHFSKKAVYGYLCSSFLVPMMISTNTIKMEDYTNLSDVEKGNLVMKSGGDAATQAVVDVLVHMYDKEYIHKYLYALTN